MKYTKFPPMKIIHTSIIPKETKKPRTIKQETKEGHQQNSIFFDAIITGLTRLIP